jgi:hypothetical protein|tara:strand:- start:819 stop:1034 length:216 start_codon:yes stop_codon:yes gene_type:complete
MEKIKMDKQSYKEMTATLIEEKTELRTKLNKIFDMVRNEPNNMRLGESIRNLYWDERDISRNNRQLDLFTD